MHYVVQRPHRATNQGCLVRYFKFFPVESTQSFSDIFLPFWNRGEKGASPITFWDLVALHNICVKSLALGKDKAKEPAKNADLDTGMYNRHVKFQAPMTPPHTRVGWSFWTKGSLKSPSMLMETIACLAFLFNTIPRSGKVQHNLWITQPMEIFLAHSMQSALLQSKPVQPYLLHLWTQSWLHCFAIFARGWLSHARNLWINYLNWNLTGLCSPPL